MSSPVAVRREREKKLPPVTEREFQRLVTDLAEVCGWRWAHFRPAATSKGWRTPVSGPLGKGFPDLVLSRERDRRIVFAELKRDGASPSADQYAVLEALEKAGAETFLWYPADFDEIAAVLR